MHIPRVLFNQLTEELDADYDDSYGNCLVNCSVKFQWNVTLNEHTFVIDETMGVRKLWDGTCGLMFAEIEDTDEE